MVQNKDLKNYLETELNNIGAGGEFSYKIYTDVTRIPATRKIGVINGILKQESSTDYVPLTNMQDIFFNYSLKFAVPCPHGSDNIEKVITDLKTLLQQINGQQQHISDGDVVFISNTLPHKTKNAQVEQTGTTAEVVCDFGMQFTDNGQLSSGYTWYIDGVVVVPMSANITLNKVGETNQLSYKETTESFSLSQTRRYSFTFIVDKTNAKIEELLNTVLDTGEINKVYTLRYTNGVVDVTKKVILFDNNNASIQLAQNSELSIVFIDTDDFTATNYYQMRLCSSMLDPNGQDTVLHTNKDRQAYYFSTLKGTDFERIPAPNISGLYAQNQLFNFDPAKKSIYNAIGLYFPYEITTLLSYNYAIIQKFVNGTLNETFYFWTNNYQGTDGKIYCNLAMDTFQTYYYDITFCPCLINRAHLGRFDIIPNGSNYNLIFRAGRQSFLNNRENVTNVSQTCILHEDIAMVNVNLSQQYAYKNVTQWIYVFLQNGTTIPNLTGGQNMQFSITDYFTIYGGYGSGFTQANSAVYNSNMYCLVFPFGERISTVGNNSNDVWDFFLFFRDLVGSTGISGQIIDIIISPMFPFISDGINLIPDYNGARINWNNMTTPNYVARTMTRSILAPDGTTKNANAMVFINQRLPIRGASCNLETLNIYLNIFPIPANPYDLESQLRDKKYNPKLYNTDYRTLKIGVSNGTNYDFDISKIGEEQFEITFINQIFPGTQQIYTSIRTDYTNLISRRNYISRYYTNETVQGLIGAMSTFDFSAPYNIEALDNWLSNNKNFYSIRGNTLSQSKLVADTQNIFSQGKNVINTATNIANSAIKGDQIGMISAIGGGTINFLEQSTNYKNTMKGLEVQLSNSDLTIDNLRSAPDEFKNLSGTPFLMKNINNNTLYLEYYSANDKDLTTADDNMFAYGYAFNQIANIGDLINTRTLFNYIQAELSQFVSRFRFISNSVRRDLRDRFSSGIRVWHGNSIDGSTRDPQFQYLYENWERYIFTLYPNYNNYPTYLSTNPY